MGAALQALPAQTHLEGMLPRNCSHSAMLLKLTSSCDEGEQHGHHTRHMSSAIVEALISGCRACPGKSSPLGETQARRWLLRRGGCSHCSGQPCCQCLSPTPAATRWHPACTHICATIKGAIHIYQQLIVPTKTVSIATLINQTPSPNINTPACTN